MFSKNQVACLTLVTGSGFSKKESNGHILFSCCISNPGVLLQVSVKQNSKRVWSEGNIKLKN